MATAHHPDFENAVQGRRWARPLKELRAALDREAQCAESGRAWRVLPGGAFVWLERIGGGRIRVTIARSERPHSEKGRKAFEREVAIFARELGCIGWSRDISPRGKGIQAVMSEPLQLDHVLGVTKPQRDALAKWARDPDCPPHLAEHIASFLAGEPSAREAEDLLTEVCGAIGDARIERGDIKMFNR